MAIKKMVPCFCQSFEFGEFDGGNEDAISYDTGCNQHTTKTFAMGHDAKLAGYLVRAEMAGEEIRMVSGGMGISFPDAVSAASKVSEAFAAKVQTQLDAARARLAKKELAGAKKAAKTQAAPKPKSQMVSAKVGRWTYQGGIGPVTGDFVYENKKGEMVTVPLGKYTLV